MAGFAAGFNAGTQFAVRREQALQMMDERQFREDMEYEEKVKEAQDKGLAAPEKNKPIDKRNTFEWIADGITSLFSGAGATGEPAKPAPSEQPQGGRAQEPAPEPAPTTPSGDGKITREDIPPAKAALPPRPTREPEYGGSWTAAPPYGQAMEGAVGVAADIAGLPITVNGLPARQDVPAVPPPEPTPAQPPQIAPRPVAPEATAVPPTTTETQPAVPPTPANYPPRPAEPNRPPLPNPPPTARRAEVLPPPPAQGQQPPSEVFPVPAPVRASNTAPQAAAPPVVQATEPGVTPAPSPLRTPQAPAVPTGREPVPIRGGGGRPSGPRGAALPPRDEVIRGGEGRDVTTDPDAARPTTPAERTVGNADADARAAQVVPDQFRQAFIDAAKKYNVPLPLLVGVARTESRNFNPNAINKNDQGQGVDSIGLFQYASNRRDFNVRDPFAQIDQAAKDLRDRYNQFNDWGRAALGHNRGTAGAANYKGNVLDDPYMRTVASLGGAEVLGSGSGGRRPLGSVSDDTTMTYGGTGEDVISGTPGDRVQVTRRLMRGEDGLPPQQYERDVVNGERRVPTREDHEKFWERMQIKALKTGNPQIMHQVQQMAGATIAGGIMRNGAYLLNAIDSGDANAVNLYGKKLWSYIPDGTHVNVGLNEDGTIKITQFDEKTGKKVGEQNMTRAQVEQMYLGALDPNKLSEIVKRRTDADLNERKFQDESRDRSRKFALDVEKHGLDLTKRDDTVEKELREELYKIQVPDAANPGTGRDLTPEEKQAAIDVARDHLGAGAGQARRIATLFAQGHLFAKPDQLIGPDGKPIVDKDGKPVTRLQWYEKVYDKNGNEILDEKGNRTGKPTGFDVGRHGQAALRRKEAETGVRKADDARREKLERDKREADKRESERDAKVDREKRIEDEKRRVRTNPYIHAPSQPVMQ